MAEWVVMIPTVPASVLSPNGQRKRPWRRRHEAAADLRQMVAEYAKDANASQVGREVWSHPARDPVAGPVRLAVVIAWPKGRRLLDFDGAVGALKPAVDALQDAGWMVNDRQVVTMEVRQERSGDVAGWTRIEMHEEAP